MNCKSFGIGSKENGVLYLHWHEHKDGILLRTAELTQDDHVVWEAKDVDIPLDTNAP